MFVMHYAIVLRIVLQRAARKAILQTIFTRIAIAAPVLGKHKYHFAPTHHQVTAIKNASSLNALTGYVVIAITP